MAEKSDSKGPGFIKGLSSTLGNISKGALEHGTDLRHVLDSVPLQDIEKFLKEKMSVPDLADQADGLTARFGPQVENALYRLICDQGDLHDLVSNAMSSGAKSGLAVVVTILVGQFALAPAVALVVATLAVKAIVSHSESSLCQELIRRRLVREEAAQPVPVEKSPARAKPAAKKSAEAVPAGKPAAGAAPKVRAAKPAPARSPGAKSELAKSAPGKTAIVKLTPAKITPVKSPAAKAEPARPAPAKSTPAKKSAAVKPVSAAKPAPARKPAASQKPEPAKNQAVKKTTPKPEGSKTTTKKPPAKKSGG